MGERAIIEKGMESLETIGQGESTTFVLPQELTRLLGRYGRQLTDSDVQESAGLDSLEFDTETRELLGLDNIEEILGQIDAATEMDVEELEQEAEAIKQGGGVDIQSPDEVVEDVDAGEATIPEADVAPGAGSDGARTDSGDADEPDGERAVETEKE
jgi:Asp-tRNA(Asn)/Glu-tRNA(Gln) amidotransferase C subunit